MRQTKRAAVIGAGAGGLTAAAYLAKAGFEVIALEQAKHTGGFLNPFVRKGFHFDPGVHYVGECRPGQVIHRVLSGLDIGVEDLFCELDPNGFDSFRFPDFEVKMPVGLDAWRYRLAEKFPQDVADIDRFFKMTKEIQSGMRAINSLSARKPRLSDVSSAPKIIAMLPWLRSTFKQMLDKTVKNKKLQAVLAAQYGDYGLPPSQASALYGIGIILHYSDGAFFPRGGSGSLRDAIEKRAKEYGAVFRTGAKVEKIIVSGAGVRGVMLSDGEAIEADVVVSNMEPAHTFASVYDPSYVPAGLRRKIKRLKPSMGSFCLFLGMKRDLSKYGMGKFNVWDYPTWDMDEAFRTLMEGRMTEGDLGLFLSPNSLKDDSGTMAPKGCSTLEVVTAAPYSIFAKWDGMVPYKRGQDYLDLKKRIADNMLANIERRAPGLVGDVEVMETASPLTNSHYINSVQGGAYGPAMTPDQIGPFRFAPAAPIKNLYLAGSGVFGCGVSPCLMSGMIAAKLAKKGMGK